MQRLTGSTLELVSTMTIPAEAHTALKPLPALQLFERCAGNWARVRQATARKGQHSCGGRAQPWHGSRTAGAAATAPAQLPRQPQAAYHHAGCVQPQQHHSMGQQPAGQVPWAEAPRCRHQQRRWGRTSTSPLRWVASLGLGVMGGTVGCGL